MNKKYIILTLVLCFSLAFVVYPTMVYASCGFFCQIGNAISAIVAAIVNVVTAVVNVVVHAVTAVVNVVVHAVQSIFTPAAQPQYRCVKCT